MNLLYSDVEEDLRATVRDLLSEHKGSPEELWGKLSRDLGVVGLAVPEDLGGAGAGWREVAVVLEELGRAVAPVPYLGSIMAVKALLEADDRSLLPQLASGELTATLAVPFSTLPGTAPTTTTTVADTESADVVIAVDGENLYQITGFEKRPAPSLDRTRPLADLDLTNGTRQRIGSATAATKAVRTGAALLASEQLGVAQWCLDTTVEYARTRYQFGRPIGSFQAVKHRLADLWAEVTEATAVARHAADLAGDDTRDAHIATALAQAHCGEIALRAAEECIQLHGGIGFTWEHPAHLYLKRARSSASAFGSADRHRAALAALLDL